MENPQNLSKIIICQLEVKNVPACSHRHRFLTDFYGKQFQALALIMGFISVLNACLGFAIMDH